MVSATARRARRVALVAVIVLLAPVWCQPVARAVEEPGAALIHLASPAPSPGPAIRRNTPAGPWAFGSRTPQGRVLAAAVLLALLALVTGERWTSLVAAVAGPSSLARRRHAIALRAPPAA